MNSLRVGRNDMIASATSRMLPLVADGIRRRYSREASLRIAFRTGTFSALRTFP